MCSHMRHLKEIKDMYVSSFSQLKLKVTFEVLFTGIHILHRKMHK